MTGRRLPLLLLGALCAPALGCGAQAANPPPSARTKAERGAPEFGSYLDGFARDAVRAGGSPLEVLASSAGIAGDSVSAFISVPKGRCALLAARGGAEIQDLDIYLYTDEGDEVLASEEIEHPATLLYCAAEGSQRVLAVARIAAGRGPYALGLVDAPLESQDALLAQVLAGAGRSAEQVSSWAGVDQALTSHRDLLGGNWRDVRRVIVPADHRLPTALDFSVEPEQCMDALLLSSAGVDDLVVEALGDGDRILARAEAEGHERALLVCAGADPATVTLRLRPHAGQGTVLVLLSRTQSRADRYNLHPEFPRHDLAPAPGPLPNPTPAAQRLELATTSLSTFALGWSGCQRVELTPRYPLLGYELAAYDAEGRLIGEMSGASSSVVHLCLPPSPNPGARMDLHATTRGGPIDVTSLAEPAAASPTLERFPLAAQRLLGLARDLGFLKTAGDIGQVTAHQLGPDGLIRIPLSVPAARCLTVLSAADRSGRGIELGLVDAETARFADYARGSRVAWARICADRGHTEHIVAELRAPHGETPVLVATRQETLTPSAVPLR